MKGLDPQELAQLLAASDLHSHRHDEECEEAGTDDVPEDKEVCDRLVQRGLMIAIDYDPCPANEEYACSLWQLTPLGRLALRLATHV